MISPFLDITELQKNKLMNLLQVHTYRYKKNQEIMPTIKTENIIGIILTGKADIINIDYSGNEIVLETLEENSVFGTYMNATNYDNIEIIAREESEVMVINHDALQALDNTKHSYYATFMRNIYNILNSRFKETNERIRILEKKTIREKLLEYFEILYKRSYTRVVESDYSFKDLADYIAANRSAMFRELRYMKEEKVIAVKGKKITLLYKNSTFLR